MKKNTFIIHCSLRPDDDLVSQGARASAGFQIADLVYTGGTLKKLILCDQLNFQVLTLVVINTPGCIFFSVAEQGLS